jgi:hypothetical protein
VLICDDAYKVRTGELGADAHHSIAQRGEIRLRHRLTIAVAVC